MTTELQEVILNAPGMYVLELQKVGVVCAVIFDVGTIVLGVGDSFTKAVLVLVFCFFDLFKMSETFSFKFSDVLLYERTPSALLCPVRSIISCSSTPAENRRVAFVARNEWLVR